MSKHEVTLYAAAARLEAVAGVCGIRRLSLQPSGRDGLVFVGEREGLSVTVRLAGLGSRAVRTAVVVEATGSPVELTLRPELAGERLDKVLGMTVDAEVGHREFDDRFVIEAAPVEAARKVLTVQGRSTRWPAHAGATLDAALSRATFTPRELGDDLDEKGRVPLARRLVAEGAVRIVRGGLSLIHI